MSERVLLECLKDDPFVQEVLSNYIHPHPGVSVADLLEELELLNKNAAYVFNHVPAPGRVSMRNLSDGEYLRLRRLRSAREAAQEPRLKEGQEVWVLAVVNRNDAPDGKTSVTICRDYPFVTAVPDENIRTEEPPEIEDVFQPAKYTTKELTKIANACYDDMHRRAGGGE